MSEKPKLNPLLSRKSGATEIYLIRHGDALPGEETVIPGGSYDEQPLSQLGQRQALALGNWLGNVTFEALYTSPLRRCRETAAPLAQLQNLPVTIEENLREVRLGLDVGGPGPHDEPGVTARALRERLDEVVRRVGLEGKWSAIPGSEDSQPFRQRVINIIHELAHRHPGQRLAVFSHGGFINAYVAELLGLERDFFFPIHNTSVSIIRCLDWQASLVSLNEIAHFRIGGVDLETF
jgi:broad specificity phosphatase PhoE